MEKKIRAPNFSDKELEFRYENNIMCIYGTSKGLEKLSNLCLELVNNPDQGHIHLENYQILKKESLTCAIAIFNKYKNE